MDGCLWSKLGSLLLELGWSSGVEVYKFPCNPTRRNYTLWLPFHSAFTRIAFLMFCAIYSLLPPPASNRHSWESPTLLKITSLEVRASKRTWATCCLRRARGGVSQSYGLLPWTVLPCWSHSVQLHLIDYCTQDWSIHIHLLLLAEPRILLKLRCKTHRPEGKPHPPICFLSLAHRNRSVKRKTWRSLRAPSTSSTMKLSFRSCRCWWETEKMFPLVKKGPQIKHWASLGNTLLIPDSYQSQFNKLLQFRKKKKKKRLLCAPCCELCSLLLPSLSRAKMALFIRCQVRAEVYFHHLSLRPSITNGESLPGFK